MGTQSSRVFVPLGPVHLTPNLAIATGRCPSAGVPDHLCPLPPPRFPTSPSYLNRPRRTVALSVQSLWWPVCCFVLQHRLTHRNSSRSNYRSPANLIWRILHWCYAHNSQISRQLDHRYSYSSAVDLEWRPRPRTSTRIKPTSNIASLASHPIPSAARRGAPLNQLPSPGVCQPLPSASLAFGEAYRPITVVISPVNPRE